MTNYLTILRERDSFILYKNQKRFFSLCRCVCGSEVKIREDMVNKRTSCGCKTTPGVYKDLSGKNFYSLTVLKRVTNRGSNIMWCCKCVCGKEVIIQGKALLSGHSKSCGCKGLETGFGFISQMFANYRTGAKRRKLDFSLTHKEFHDLIIKNCHYCGSLPVLKTNRADVKRGAFRDIIPINGIDRVSSDLGYTIDNCVPCCTTCNFAKSSSSYQDFKAWCLQLSRYVLVDIIHSDKIEQI